MDIPKEIQHVLDRRLASEIAAYVERRNRCHPDSKATLRRVARRFRMSQAEAQRVIDGSGFMVVSEFAYCPPKTNDWGNILLAAWYPQHSPDALPGDRLVVVFDEEQKAAWLSAISTATTI